jgi:hypothetical protein
MPDTYKRSLKVLVVLYCIILVLPDLLTNCVGIKTNIALDPDVSSSQLNKLALLCKDASAYLRDFFKKSLLSYQLISFNPHKQYFPAFKVAIGKN